MKYAICYFSGTGNTDFVAKRLAHHLEAIGNYCELIHVEDLLLDKRTLNISDYDLIGFGYPVYAMDAPSIMYDFVAKIRPGKFKYFLFKTAGDPFMDGGSFLPFSRELGTLGGSCRYQQLFVMPPNMGINRAPAAIKDMCVKADILCKRMADELAHGIVRKQPSSLLTPLFLCFAKLERKGAAFVSKRWKVSDACNLCGVCFKNCPTANISVIAGKLSFGTSCVMCLRCMMSCPTNAIDAPPPLNYVRVKPYDLQKIFTDDSIPAGFYDNSKSSAHSRWIQYYKAQKLM